MRIWTRFLVAAAAPLMLSGCLWGPGKFGSELALRKNGTFTLDYRGEILFQMPDKNGEAVPWEDGMARCYADGHSERAGQGPVDDSSEKPDESHRIQPCTAKRLANLKAEHDKEQAERAASKRKENEEMAKVFGLPGTDEESNRKFADKLMKYQGWKSVAYKGKGVYEVVYHYDGRLGQDFAFPLMPDSELMIPFVMIRTRADGSIQVSAPAFVGAQGVLGVRAGMQGLPVNKDGPTSRAQGRFTVTTDGEILTNNSEDGPVAGAGGRQVHWDVSSQSNRIPEMLVKLR